MVLDKIYIDLDGVLADFNGHFENLYNQHPGDFEKEFGQILFWEKVYETPHFFRDMPPMKDKDSLWGLCQQHCDNLVILSSPSQTNQPICILDKRHWVDSMLGENVPAIFEKHKHIYARPNRLLIDDTKAKLDKWVEAGGIGHLYTDFKALQTFMATF